MVPHTNPASPPLSSPDSGNTPWQFGYSRQLLWEYTVWAWNTSFQECPSSTFLQWPSVCTLWSMSPWSPLPMDETFPGGSTLLQPALWDAASCLSWTLTHFLSSYFYAWDLSCFFRLFSCQSSYFWVSSLGISCSVSSWLLPVLASYETHTCINLLTHKSLNTRP